MATGGMTSTDATMMGSPFRDIDPRFMRPGVALLDAQRLLRARRERAGALRRMYNRNVVPLRLSDVEFSEVGRNVRFQPGWWVAAGMLLSAVLLAGYAIWALI